jgi:hypothetical protein
VRTLVNLLVWLAIGTLVGVALGGEVFDGKEFVTPALKMS